MNSITRLVALTLGLVLMLPITPSWGQPVCASPGCNPTTSDANSNTAGGTGALSSLAVGGNSNTAFGRNALNSNTTGDFNTATGNQALLTNTTGNGNTASGHNALNSNTTGSFNTASGSGALASNTAGTANTASGVSALVANTTGIGNTASGGEALFHNTTGNFNTASGRSALRNTTTGYDNTASGHLALEGNITGFGNTAAGRDALLNSTGNKNIGIGYRAGTSLGTGNNNIYIGNQGAGDESQTIRIGTAQTETFIAGIAGAFISLNVNGATMAVDTTTGQLGIGVQISSSRYKRDIATMGTRSEGVLNLRPVTFVYRDDSKGTTHYGLIAEEVATVYPELVTYTPTGEVQGVRYQELIPMLLNELQRQRHEFQQALQAQQKELAELRALVGQGRGKVVFGAAGE